MKNLTFVFWITCFFFSAGLRASWYAQVANGEKISECIKWDEPIDQSWTKMNKSFGTICQLSTDGGSGIMGYIFRCGPNNTQFIFRSQEKCEFFKANTNKNFRPALVNWAPENIKNPEGWVVSIENCFGKIATQKNITLVGLQRLDDYCVCTANQLGTYSDQEIGVKIITGIIKSCAEKIGGNLPLELEKSLEKSASNLLISAKNKKENIERKQSVAVGENLRSGERQPIMVEVGQDYSKIMETLKKFNKPTKTTWDNTLVAKFKDQSLLLYPDSNGECSLTFEDGILKSCTGCTTKIFHCKN